MRRWVIGLVGCALVVGGLVWALAGRDGRLDLSQRTDLMAFACGAIGVVGLVATFWRRVEEDEAASVARLAREVKVIGEPQWTSSLGGDLTAIDVTFAFRPYANSRAAALPASPEGRLEKVVEDYRGLRPRRLVITGEPGAGKTILARKFVMELNRVRAEDEPVPVLVSLADWDPGEPLRDWLTRHLELDYGMPAASARRVVAARMVLPVLDGLDEMDPGGTTGAASRASRALAALARHQDGIEPGPLVLTCRTREYDLLEADGDHILDAARIEIDPVTPDQARAFLSVRGAARRPALWQPLLDELRDRPGGVVARALSTPWRLTLAAVAYDREGDPGELLAASREAEVADWLLARFIGASAANTPAGAGRYAPLLVHRALRAVAVMMGPDTDLWLLELGRFTPRWLWLGVVRGVTGAAVVAQAVYLWRSDFNSPTGWLGVFGTGLIACACFRRGTLPSARVVTMPRLGSPLWGVGLRRVLRQAPRRGWGRLMLVAGLFAVWQALPASLGGRGAIQLLVMAAAAFAILIALAAGLEVDSASIGPTGQLRGQLLLLCVYVVMFAIVYVIPAPKTPTVPLIALFVAFGAATSGVLVGYLMFLAVQRGRLPLRLARFLDWSVGAGLLRTSGAAYQFRHREFQEWLVRHPVP